MSAEQLSQIAEWEDEDTNDGEWPYPTRYVKSQITGELAERCRAALGAPHGADVFITEQVESGGYSEFTQEDWTSFTIESDDRSVTFDQNSWNDSTFVQLLKWLDKQ